MDDLVRKRTLPESAGGPEVLIQFAARPGEAEPGYAQVTAGSHT
jgi:hypothetical protein